jgi:hypothetical protein
MSRHVLDDPALNACHICGAAGLVLLFVWAAICAAV